MDALGLLLPSTFLFCFAFGSSDRSIFNAADEMVLVFYNLSVYFSDGFDSLI